MTTYGTKLTVKMQSIPYTITQGVDYFLRFRDGEEIRAAFVKPDGGNINIMSNSSRLNGGNSIQEGLMRELSGRFSQNYYISVDSDKTTGLMPEYIVGIREVNGPPETKSQVTIPKSIHLKINEGKGFDAELGKIYQFQIAGHQWWKGVIVVQEHKVLMLSNNRNWNGGHKLSEKNKSYGFLYQWHFGGIEDLINGKDFHYSDIYNVVEDGSAEPVQVEERMTKTEYIKRQLIEVNEATKEQCCAGTTRRKAKLVFKKIR